MATLASTVINRVLNQFHYRDPVLTLTGAITNSETPIQVNAFLPSVGTGSILQIGEEYILVTAVSGTTTLTLTVIRGWLGSTAASHSMNDPVYINPTLKSFEVLPLVNECLRMIYPHLFVVDTTTLSYSPASLGYDMPANCGFPLRVDAQQDSIAYMWKRINDWQYIPNADTTDFPNGKAIILNVALPNGNKVKVIYAKQFTSIAASSDDLEAVAGMQEYMTDLPYYYAMNKLVAGMDVDRADTSGASSHQRAADVPPFLGLRTADWYRSRYEDLLMNAVNTQKMEVRPGNNIGGYGN